MRIGTGLLVCVVIALAAEQVAAQTAPSSPQPDNNNIWQTGTGPIPGYARQTPNVQPTTQAMPAGTPTALPAWYSQGSGIAVGGGRFYADGTVGTFYDDNVFATNVNRQHDFAFFQRPEAAWVKQGQNYTVSADGFVEGREYSTFTSEDQINGGVGSNFTVMPDNDTQIVGGVRYLHEHLDRGSSETVVTIPGMPSTLLSTLFEHPVAYDEGLQSIAFNKRYGNWWSSIGGAGLEINYQNPIIASTGPLGPSPYGGDTVNLNYADGAIGAGNARVGYVVAPLTSVFGEAAVNTRDWGVGYFDSNGYRLVMGMLFEQGPGARVRGEFWAGYMNQQYNGVTMQRISTWTGGLNMIGVITNDLSAIVEAQREAKEAALGLALVTPTELAVTPATCAAGIAVCVSNVESEAGARLDYRILPRVVISGGVTYLEDDYQGPLAFGRVDRTLGPIAAVKYYPAPDITVGFDYRNVSFESTGGTAPPGFTTVAALPFFKDVFMLWVNAKLTAAAPPIIVK
jgi:Putative beta-barrel porin 2